MSNSSHSSSSLLLPAILVAAFVLLSWVFVSNSYAYALINLGPKVDYGAGASVNPSLDTSVDSSKSATSSGSGSTNVGARAGATSGLDAEALTEGEKVEVNRAMIDTGADAGTVVEPRAVITKGDLEAYAAGAVRADTDIEAMNFTGETVEVRYKEDGKFLALVPITFTVRAIAHADGTVELKYPWYSMLTVDNQGELETKLQVAVDNALKARLVGSVQAEGVEANPTFTAAESATVAAQIHAVLKRSAVGDY